eukprot:s2592_g8.t3
MHSSTLYEAQQIPEMSRFAAWAKKQQEDQAEGLVLAGIPIESLPKRQLEPFLVDNSLLVSHSAGLRYRSARDLVDKNQAVAEAAVPHVYIGGIQVLKVLPSAPPREDSDDEDKQIAENETRLGTLKVPSMFRPVTEDASIEALGHGALYHVVAERVAVREGPSLGAAAVSSLRRGADVEVFGWDDSRLWRRCREKRTGLLGWLLLDHPDIGALIRPKGCPICSRPLEPLCAAAGEGRVEDLRRFLSAEPYGVAVAARDIQGRGPLEVAAAAGHLDCIVWIVEAGADAAEALDKCRDRGESLGQAAVLLAALAGRSPDQAALRAMLAGLAPQERHAAEAMAAARRRGVMAKDDLLEAMEEAATDVPDSPQRPELPGALSAVAAAAEAQQGAAGAPKLGVLYEVIYDAVWIRREPNAKGDKLTKRVKNDRLRVLGLDETQNWGKVHVNVREGELEGWVMLHHEELGELIRTGTFCPESETVGKSKDAQDLDTMLEFSDRNMEDFAKGHIDATKPVDEWMLDKLAENIKIYCALLGSITQGPQNMAQMPVSPLRPTPIWERSHTVEPLTLHHTVTSATMACVARPTMFRTITAPPLSRRLFYPPARSLSTGAGHVCAALLPAEGSFQTDSDVDCAGQSTLDSLKPGVLQQMQGMNFDRLTEIQQLALLTPHLVLRARTLRNPTKLLLLIQARGAHLVDLSLCPMVPRRVQRRLHSTLHQLSLEELLILSLTKADPAHADAILRALQETCDTKKGRWFNRLTGCANSASEQPFSLEAALSSEEVIEGLSACLGPDLAGLRPRIEVWAEEQGAAFLEELIQHAPEMCVSLGLSQEEASRLFARYREVATTLNSKAAEKAPTQEAAKVKACTTPAPIFRRAAVQRTAPMIPCVRCAKQEAVLQAVTIASQHEGWGRKWNECQYSCVSCRLPILREAHVNCCNTCKLFWHQDCAKAKQQYTAARRASAVKAKNKKASPAPSMPAPVPAKEPARSKAALPRASTVQPAGVAGAVPSKVFAYAPLVRTVTVPGTKVEIGAARQRAQKAYIPLQAWNLRMPPQKIQTAAPTRPSEPPLTATEELVEYTDGLPGRVERRADLDRHGKYRAALRPVFDREVQALIRRRPPQAWELQHPFAKEVEEDKALASVATQGSKGNESRGFQRLQDDFLRTHGHQIKEQLSSVFQGPISIKHAEVGRPAQERFMDAMSEGYPLLPAFHGSQAENYASICSRGLLIPGRDNELKVVHGSVHGRGIYTAGLQNPRLSAGFCTDPKMLVCGVLDDSQHLAASRTLGNHQLKAESQAIKHVGDAIVVFDERRVVPLFQASGSAFQHRHCSAPLPTTVGPAQVLGNWAPKRAAASYNPNQDLIHNGIITAGTDKVFHVRTRQMAYLPPTPMSSSDATQRKRIYERKAADGVDMYGPHMQVRFLVAFGHGGKLDGELDQPT